MKDCPEITELLLKCIGDEAIGFFERKLNTAEQEMSVFIPVYQNTKSKDLVN